MPWYPARYPASASRSDSENVGRTVAGSVDVDVDVDVDVAVVLIRHLPKQPEPGRRDRRGPQQ
jgi:hypothetical protein